MTNMQILKTSIKKGAITAFWVVWLVAYLCLMAVFPIYGLYNQHWTVWMVWLQVWEYPVTGLVMAAIFLYVNPFRTTHRQSQKDNN